MGKCTTIMVKAIDIIYHSAILCSKKNPSLDESLG